MVSRMKCQMFTKIHPDKVDFTRIDHNYIIFQQLTYVYSVKAFTRSDFNILLQKSIFGFFFIADFRLVSW